MKATRRADGAWITDHPADLSAWLWANDGTEAVVIDGNRYFCATEQLMTKFRDAWATERRRNDKRTAAMFIDLARELFQRKNT